METESNQELILLRKFITSIGTIATVVIVTFFIISIWARERALQINNLHFPILERSAINLRLNQNLPLLLEKMVNEKKLQSLEDYELNRSALDFNLSELEQLIERINLPQKTVKYLNRSNVNVIEDKIIEELRNENFDKAKEIIETNNYQSVVHDYTDHLQLISEELLIARERFLVAQNTFFIAMMLVSVFSIVTIILLLVRIMGAFKQSVKEKAETDRLLEEEKAKSVQSAKLAALGEMAGGIAHEINNPLGIIKGYAEIGMEELSLPDPNMKVIKASFDKVFNTTERIARIVKGMRTISRDTKTDLMEEVSIEEIIEDVFSLCKEKFKSRGIDLQYLNHNLSTAVFCKQVEITQVLTNFLNNAHDAIIHLEEKWVKVEVKNLGSDIEIRVTDSGSGIPIEIQEKVFQPFFTTKDVGQGTGLGLSISKSIIEKHNGKIIIDNENPNTSIVILLPNRVMDTAVA